MRRFLRWALWVSVGCAALAIGLSAAARVRKMFDPACVRLEAKVAVIADFCEGLAERAASERCADLAGESEDAVRACAEFFKPVALSNCYEHVGAREAVRTLRLACE